MTFRTIKPNAYFTVHNSTFLRKLHNNNKIQKKSYMTVFEKSKLLDRSFEDERQIRIRKALPFHCLWAGAGKKRILFHRAIIVGLCTTHQNMLQYMFHLSSMNHKIIYLLSDINMHIWLIISCGQKTNNSLSNQ